jgi:spore maturation protein B
VRDLGGPVLAAVVGRPVLILSRLAVYFGAVGVRRTRHAVPAALTADITAAIAAVAVWAWLL